MDIFRRTQTMLNIPARSQSESDLETTTRNLLAFRTIIAMLSYMDSHNSRLATMAPIGESKDRKELRVLDALSTVLIREHEKTAVVAADDRNFTFSLNTRVANRRGKINGHTDSLINCNSFPEIRIAKDFDSEAPFETFFKNDW